jgi:hypothetical protein
MTSSRKSKGKTLKKARSKDPAEEAAGASKLQIEPISIDRLFYYATPYFADDSPIVFVGFCTNFEVIFPHIISLLYAQKICYTQLL